MVSTVLMSNAESLGVVGVEGHLDVEGLLDREDRLDEAEEVDAEVGERRFGTDLGRIEHRLLGKDRDHLVAHALLDCVGHDPSVGRTCTGTSNRSRADWKPVFAPPRGAAISRGSRRSALYISTFWSIRTAG